MSMQKRLGLLSVISLVVVFFIMDSLNIRFVAEPPLVLPVLNTVFIGFVSIAAACTASGIYLSSNMISILLIGDGLLLFGLGASMAGWLRFLPNGVNTSVTIYNLCALLGSILCLAGAIRRTLLGVRSSEGKGRLFRLFIAHGVVLAIVAGVSVAAAMDLIPMFFIQDTGPTLLRQIVMYSAIVLNYASSVLFLILFIASKLDYLFWLCLSFGTTASGFFIVTYGVVALGSPISWIGRGGSYFGGLFAWVAIISLIHFARKKHLSIDKTLNTFFFDAEASYKSLVESSADAIVSTDQDFSIFITNSAAEELFGYERNGMLGSNLFDRLTTDQMEELVRKNADASLFPGKTRHPITTIEMEIRKKDGTPVPVEFSISSRMISKGQVHTFIIRDITERKKAEDEINKYRHHLEDLVQDRTRALTQQNVELEIQKQQLNEVSRLKSSFLSNMSHELRTPLNSVISLTTVLNRRLKGLIPDQESGYLDVIERNGKSLLDLVNDILDLSRIESGKEDLHVSRFNMRQLVKDIVEMMDVQAKMKGIAIQIGLDRNLPEIVSDMDKCRHVLQNVIGNAMKFTNEGNVEITGAVVGDAVELRVRDTGIGIEPKHLDFIFDAFRQADETMARRNGGTGLGLAIARRYAQMMGGTLTVQSKIGQGSVFTFRLPLTLSGKEKDQDAEAAILPMIGMPVMLNPVRDSGQALPDPGLPDPALPDPGLPDPGLPDPGLPDPAKAIRFRTTDRPVILIVEDNPDNVLTLRALLQEACDLLEAGDGEDGIRQAMLHHPALILMDISMPVMDGIQALQIIRREPEIMEIPVVALTAHAMTGDREELLAYGFDGYVSKPVDADHLDKAIRSCLFGNRPACRETTVGEEPGR